MEAELRPDAEVRGAHQDRHGQQGQDQLVVGFGPVPPSLTVPPPGLWMRARLGPAGMLRTMPMLPDGPRPRRYELAARSSVCHRTVDRPDQ